MSHNRFLSSALVCALLLSVLLSGFSGLVSSAYGHDANTPLPDGAYKTWKQQDPRWSDLVIGVDPWRDSDGVKHTYETVGHAGCLITSMAILARGHGLLLNGESVITPGTLAEALYDEGSEVYLKSGGACRYQTAFEALIPGVSYVETVYSPSAKTIARYLNDTDHTYLLIGGVNSGAHYVAIDYVDPNGKRVYVCDPGRDNDLLFYYSASFMLVFEADESRIAPPESPSEGERWKVTTETVLRIRSGPGLSYDILGSYRPGTEILVTETEIADGYLWGKTAEGWTALRTDGKDPESVFCEPIEELPKHTVLLHANDGTDFASELLKTETVSLLLPDALPERDGFLCLGWAYEPDAVSAAYAPNDPFERDDITDLYAVWMSSSDLFGFGVDVSSHQKTIDWETVAGTGLTFAVIRAGTSKGDDTCFEQNYAGAKAAGILTGCYYYSYAVTMKELEEDVDNFIRLLSGKTWDLPVYLDLESSAQKALGAEVLNGFVTAAMKKLDESGYYAGVYSSESWFNKLISPDSCGGTDHVWMAKWMDSRTLSQNLTAVCGLYQYSDQGYIDGIPARVDLDVCYLDYPSLIRSLGKNGFPAEGTGGDDPPDDPPVEPTPVMSALLFEEDDLIVGGYPGMRVEDWVSCLPDPTDVTVTSADGAPVSPDEPVRTGLSVRIGEKACLMVLPGDLNGDGEIDILDYTMEKQAVLGVRELPRAAYRAALLDGTDLTVRTYTKLKKYVLGTYALFPYGGIQPDDP